MALVGYNSECKLHQKIIISKDKKNPQKHIATNVDESAVYQYLVDGYVIKEGKKCDYLLWNEDKERIYLIELKGSDLEYALIQISETEKNLRRRFLKEIGKCKFFYRVILNRARTHSIESNNVKKFKKEHPGALVYRTNEYSEDI